MAVVKQPVSTGVAQTITGIATLAAATYAASAAISTTTNQPTDVIVELTVATTNAVAGNKQLLVFVQASLDGTNFSSGPTSGTTTTDQPDLYFIGAVPMNTATNTHQKAFSMASALGFVPAAYKIVVLNDLGVALTSGSCKTYEINPTVA